MKKILSLFAGLFLFVVSYAQTIRLDSSFGNGGWIATPGIQFTSITTQNDAKIVAAGYNSSGTDFAVARYNPNGSLDNSFGVNGVVITDFPESSHSFLDRAYAVAIQTNGKNCSGGEDCVFVCTLPI
jgi:uncharacterized delta-60 repeat protein